METAALTVAVIEFVLAGWISIIHLRKPLTGGPLTVYRASMALTALSLSLIAGSVMMTQPESRGFFVVLAAAVGVGLWALRSKAGAPRIGPLHSETESAARPQPRAAAPAGYTVRQAPQPAHANVKAQAAQPGARSARVRRIMAMEEIGYGD